MRKQVIYGDGYSGFLVEAEAPQGVAEDFVLNALSLTGIAFNRYAWARRGKHVEAIRGADLVNAEQVSAVADHDNAMHSVGSGDDRETLDGFIGARALGFSDNVGLGNTSAFKILLPHGAFGILIAAIAAESDDERRDSAVIEGFSVIESGAEYGGRMAIMFGGSKHGDDISGRRLIV